MKTSYKPLVISAGLVCGHTDHLLRLHDSFVKKKWIEADEKVDFAIHTWDIPFNNTYIESLDSYKEKFNIILATEPYENEFLPVLDELVGEDVPYVWKPYLLFYSFWKACQLISPKIDSYDIVIKYKTDIQSDGLPFGVKEDIPLHFKTISHVSFPLLFNYSFEDCIYGIRIYDGIEERCFTTFPKVIKKLFLKKDLSKLMEEIQTTKRDLYSQYIKPYTRQDLMVIQGPALWGEFMRKNDIPIIGTDLTYAGRDRGDISPKFTIRSKEKQSYVVNPENYTYIYKKSKII